MVWQVGRHFTGTCCLHLWVRIEQIMGWTLSVRMYVGLLQALHLWVRTVLPWRRERASPKWWYLHATQHWISFRKFHVISQRLKMKMNVPSLKTWGTSGLYLLKIFLESLIYGVFCLTDMSVRPGYFCLSVCFFFLLPFLFVLSGIFKSTPVACWKKQITVNHQWIKPVLKAWNCLMFERSGECVVNKWPQIPLGG